MNALAKATNLPVTAPNFEGEEMRVPTSANLSAPEPTASNSIINGPILLLLLTIMLALLGGIYYWYTILMSSTEFTDTTVTATEMTTETVVPADTTSETASDVITTSDELAPLEADIKSVRFDSVDDNFNAVETELNGALETTN